MFVLPAEQREHGLNDKQHQRMNNNIHGRQKRSMRSVCSAVSLLLTSHIRFVMAPQHRAFGMLGFGVSSLIAVLLSDPGI